MSLEFEWDDAKAKANCQKHGVTFDEALTVFGDPLAQIFDDPDHAEEEPREIIVGYSSRHRLLLVVFTERFGRVRLIHARQPTKSERERHEEEIDSSS